MDGLHSLMATFTFFPLQREIHKVAAFFMRANPREEAERESEEGRSHILL